MIHTNRHRPDTCGCILEYQWDDTVPEALRVHVPTAVVACPAHASEPTVAAIHTKVNDENRKKNRCSNEMAELLSGAGATEFPAGRSVEFWYDASRVLNIRLTGFTTQQRNNIATIAAKYGAVVV